MTLSIDVLPAPLGPMMARISPFLMSNDTPRIARTPPKESETFSTDSSTSSEGPRRSAITGFGLNIGLHSAASLTGSTAARAG